MKALFDFEFNTLVTPKLIRGLYKVLTILGCIVIGITSLVGIKSTYGLSLLLVPLVGLLYLLIFRIIYESVVIRFQMAEDIRAIKNKYVP